MEGGEEGKRKGERRDVIRARFSSCPVQSSNKSPELCFIGSDLGLNQLLRPEGWRLAPLMGSAESWVHLWSKESEAALPESPWWRVEDL